MEEQLKDEKSFIHLLMNDFTQLEMRTQLIINSVQKNLPNETKLLENLRTLHAKTRQSIEHARARKSIIESS